jgi:hypothetical protein
MSATATTKKVRASQIAAGMEVVIDGQPVKVAAVKADVLWPAIVPGLPPVPPRHQFVVQYVEGSGYAQSVFTPSEWVEVVR